MAGRIYRQNTYRDTLQPNNGYTQIPLRSDWLLSIVLDKDIKLPQVYTNE